MGYLHQRSDDIKQNAVQVGMAEEALPCRTRSLIPAASALDGKLPLMTPSPAGADVEILKWRRLILPLRRLASM
jgi:hypothetical protein